MATGEKKSTDGRSIKGLLSDGGPLYPKFGFDRGFQTFRRPEADGELSWEQLCEEAVTWMLSDRAQPFFLFLHTFEVHQPYTHQTGDFSTPEEARSAGYDAGLKHTDSVLGRILFQALRRFSLMDETILVVTSDRGEALFDRVISGRGDDHGYHLFDEVLHVPLILRLPEPRLRFRASAAPAQLVDVMPTILSLTSMSMARRVCQGQILAPLFEGECETLQRRALFAEAPFQGPGRRSSAQPQVHAQSQDSNPIRGWVLGALVKPARPFRKSSLQFCGRP